MRTTMRWILVLGCASFVALYILQNSISLAVTPLIAGTGIIAGLIAAKWLPWSWYGRQFSAGVRLGTLACGLAAAGVLLSLVGPGTHTVSSMTAHSHTPGIDISPLVASLGGSGWFLPYFLFTLFFAVCGILLAGIVAQITGWSKSLSTSRAIAAAQNAAAMLQRNPTWGPTTNAPQPIGGYYSGLSSSDPASHPGLLPASGHPSGAYANIAAHPSGAYVSSQPSSTHPSGAYASQQQPSSWNPRKDWMDSQPLDFTPLPPLSPLDFEDSGPLAPLPKIAEDIPQRRTNSSARPVHDSMTDDLRSVLERWDSNPLLHSDTSAGEVSESGEDDADKAAASKTPAATKPKTPAKRQPKASAYLNSEPATAPKRNRKKQNTRDWLC